MDGQAKRPASSPRVTCDPLGFPRRSLYETRGIAFEHVPAGTPQLYKETLTPAGVDQNR